MRRRAAPTAAVLVLVLGVIGSGGLHAPAWWIASLRLENAVAAFENGPPPTIYEDWDMFNTVCRAGVENLRLAHTAPEASVGDILPAFGRFKALAPICQSIHRRIKDMAGDGAAPVMCEVTIAGYNAWLQLAGDTQAHARPLDEAVAELPLDWPPTAWPNGLGTDTCLCIRDSHARARIWSPYEHTLYECDEPPYGKLAHPGA